MDKLLKCSKICKTCLHVRPTLAFAEPSLQIRYAWCAKFNQLLGLARVVCKGASWNPDTP